ncbi:hypothetical protein ElyMa_000210600 [Elysia marginata]|uniref:Uncharacterized protein n=1 Tax=Elysia marginata TaxID=1093978 RepID=A0AAV4EYW0_9GAST|nr:hypothetical protein ElyMa_000210600 [Elysia marginata]
MEISSSSRRESMWEPRLLNRRTTTVALLAVPGVTLGVDPHVPRFLYLSTFVPRTCGRRRRSLFAQSQTGEIGFFSRGARQVKSGSFVRCPVAKSPAKVR